MKIQFKIFDRYYFLFYNIKLGFRFYVISLGSKIKHELPLQTVRTFSFKIKPLALVHNIEKVISI